VSLSRNYSKAVLFTAVLGSLFSFCVEMSADTFGTGVNTFEIDFVTIGNPGAGSVPYLYRISPYEISEQMIHKANAAAAGTANPLNITIDARGPDYPATNITWFEAARFVNWLNTSSGHSPAYKFDVFQFSLWEPSDPGYDPTNLFRNSLAKYFLPDIDEWHKAAYYDAATNQYWTYPTGTHGPPIPVASGTEPNTAVYHQRGPPGDVGPAEITNAGGLSPYGTMAQGGNVFEWHETELDLVNNDPNSSRVLRGGSWDSTSASLVSGSGGGISPYTSHPELGIRIASVPEPFASQYFWLFCLMWFRLQFRRAFHDGVFGDSSRWGRRVQRSSVPERPSRRSVTAT
jgi:hypothetical protein